MTIGPDGQPSSAPMSAETAARVEAALGRAFGQAGAQAFGQAMGQAPGGPGFPPPGGPAFGQPAARAFPQPGGPPFPPPGTEASAFPQVSWSDQDQAAAPHGGFDPAESAQFLASGGGEQAGAIVLAAQDVPGLPAPGGTVDLTLRVTRADGSVYTTPTRISFTTPERRAAIAAPGTRLKVRIDPNVPTRIVIDPAGLF